MKNLIKKIFTVNNKIFLIDILVITISLIYLIFFDGFDKPISYILYFLMSYSLICIVLKIYTSLKKIINNLIESNKYLKKYKDDVLIRNRISLFISTCLNIIYTLFKFISGILFKSLWFISFSLYYLLLVIMRINLVKAELNKKNSIKEQYIRYRNTGIILLFMNVVLSIIILVIVNEKIFITYPNEIAIGIAAYTFYILISSIITLIKYRKLKSPLVSASKVVNVVTSLISMLSLELVLLSVYGIDSSLEFKNIMIMATGGGISLIIIVIALYMIIKSTEWLKNERLSCSNCVKKSVI